MGSDVIAHVKEPVCTVMFIILEEVRVPQIVQSQVILQGQLRTLSMIGICEKTVLSVSINKRLKIF